MTEDTLLATIELRDVLKSIEMILKNYNGIKGNEKYVSYCLKKAEEIKPFDEKIRELFDSVFHENKSKRRGINVAELNNIITKCYKLLDDIDTASDMFKPVWCTFSFAVANLSKLRWLYVYLKDDKEKNSSITVGDNLYRIEERVGLYL